MAEEPKIRWHKLVALFIFFFIYLFLGAIIFHYLETDAETKARIHLQRAKSDLLDYGCLDEDHLEEFVEKVKRSIKGGINPSGNTTYPSNWDYASAFFFSGTVVTTIGYGKTVPTTDEGRNICLLYALFGIPFTGWLLATVGDFYYASFQKMTRTIEDFIHLKLRFKHRRTRKTILCFVIFAVSYGLIVLFPSSWFYIMEKWTFDEAHYYSFITLSTIGFGDFVAAVDATHPRNQNLKWVYDIAVACWYVFGLSYLAVVITAVGKNQKHTITRMRTTIKNSVDNSKEPPPDFGLDMVESAMNDIEVNVCVCTCKCTQHNQLENSKSFKEQSTQTTDKENNINGI